MRNVTWLSPGQSVSVARSLAVSVALSLALSLTFIAGCGQGTGKGNSDGGGGPIVTYNDLQAALIAVNCQSRAKCGSIAAAAENKCETDGKAALMTYPPAYDPSEAVAAKRISFDAAAAQKCLDAYKSAGCTFDQYLEANKACTGVIKGLVADAGMCKASVECATGYCDQGKTATDGCPGTCKPFLKAGDTCDTAAPHCGDANFCESKSKKCVARAGSGVACGSNPRCQFDLFCHGYVAATMTTKEKQGVCGPAGKAGDACTNFFFGNTDCTPGLYCDDSLAMPLCAARLNMGGTCSAIGACIDGLDCIGLDYDMNGKVKTKGVCKAFLGLSAQCDPNVYETGCPYDLTCDATMKSCEAFGLAGADCSAQGTQGNCGDNLYCDSVSLKCTAQVAFGGGCVPPGMVMGMVGADPCHDGSCGAGKVCGIGCM